MVTPVGWKQLMLLPLLWVVTLPLHANLLTLYTWQNRILLIHGQQQSPEYQQTMKTLNNHQCALDERRMIIAEVPANGTGSINGRIITAIEAGQIRGEFDINSRQLTYILIGKDGTEKYRGQGILDLQLIFQLVDGMPMRQQEMLQGFNYCQPASR